MIIDLKTTTGLIYALCEFNIVDENTRLDDNGKYVNIGYTWIHSNFRDDYTLKLLLQKVFEKSNKAEFVYWKRDKKNNPTGIHCISKCLKKFQLCEV